jgi:hypothetical protein
MQCSPLKVNRCFRRTRHLHLQSRRINQARNQHEAGSKQSLAYFVTQKLEVTCSSKALVDLKWTTLCYIPEDRTLHNHCCENLKSYRSSHLFTVLLAMLSVSNTEPYNAIAWSQGPTTLTTRSSLLRSLLMVTGSYTVLQGIASCLNMLV